MLGFSSHANGIAGTPLINKMIFCFLKKHPVSSFVFLTYGISWTTCIPWAVGGAWAFPIIFFVGALGPVIAAILVTSIVEGREGVRYLVDCLMRWRVRWHWWLFAGLFFPVVLILSDALHDIFWEQTQSVVTSSERVSGHPSPELLAFSIPFLAVLEEIGWRGYAFPRLQERFNPLVACIIVGAIWACWHLPLFLLKGASHSQMPFLPYLIFAIGISVWFGWLYLETNSILLVSVFHASLNYTGMLPVSRSMPVLFVAGVLGLLLTIGLIVAAHLTRTRDNISPRKSVESR